MRDYRRWPSLPVFAASVTPAERRALAADPQVRLISPQQQYRTHNSPGVLAARIPYAWERGYTGTAAPVALVDTGVSPGHPDFATLQVQSAIFLDAGKNHPCFDDDATNPRDLQGHGTRTASILVGAAPGIQEIYSLKAGFKPKTGTPNCPAADGILLSTDIFDALDYAIRKTPAKVINLSLGAPAISDDDLMSKVMDYVADVYNVTLVFSAGNSGPDGTINSPGISYNGLTVSNIDTQGNPHFSSTRGPTPGLRRKPDVAAVGVNVAAADAFSNDLTLATGTSASAPLVSAAAALLYESGIQDALAIKAALINNTGQSGAWRNDLGWGPLQLAPAFDNRFQTLRGQGTSFFRLIFNGPAKGTLVWNRRVNTDSPEAPSPLSSVTAIVYRAGAEVLRTGPDANGNVLQLELAPGDYTLKIETADPTETFALAWNRPGITTATAPALDFTCAYPSSIAASRTLTVACTATNTGGTDLWNVTGTVFAPAGFSSGGPQSFGNLLPGAARTLTWNIAAASTTGTYDISASATVNGVPSVTTQASPMPSIQVVAAPDVPALSPIAASFTDRATVQITNPGTRPWIVSSRPSFVSASVTAAANITFQSNTTTPGTYQGTYTVSNGLSTLTGTVRLTVPPAITPQIEAARIAINPQVVVGCPAPEAVVIVSEAALPSVWFFARTVQQNDRALVRWLNPNGETISQTSLPMPNEANPNGYCFSAAAPAFRTTGTWTAEIYWNGIRQTQIPFTVRSRIDTIKNTFVWPATIQTTRQPDTLRFVYVEPGSGTRYTTAPDAPLGGNWTVEIYTDHGKVEEIPIHIAPPAEVTTLEIKDGQLSLESDAEVLVRFINPSGTVVDEARRTSGRFDIPSPNEFGTWQVRVIAGGVTVRLLHFDQLPFALYKTEMDRNGDYSPLDRQATLTVEAEQTLDVVYVHLATGRQVKQASLPIAGAIGARYTGRWEARAVDPNSRLIFARVPFTIAGPGILPDGAAWAPLQQ
ncbi:hypothetical protein F183_A48810 [Bryobacterales bacterium F-183]|nr:hypothetical protein F183_A48810 [Bryobacterales bacterium F-183]